jgi:hypothetical protein
MAAGDAVLRMSPIYLFLWRLFVEFWMPTVGRGEEFKEGHLEDKENGVVAIT